MRERTSDPLTIPHFGTVDHHQHVQNASAQAPQGEERRVIHRLLKRVTEDLATLKYNTAVAALMGYLNSLETPSALTPEELRTLLMLLAPMTSYITEELWQKLKHPGQNLSIHATSWPSFDAEAIEAETMILPIQINGWVRGRIEVAHDTPEAEIKSQALQVPQVQSLLATRKVTG
jgi:leucyl-tRNA synthetase